MYNVHDLLYLYPQYHVTGWHVWYNIISRAKQLSLVAMADKMGSVQVGQSILFLDIQASAKGMSMGSLSVCGSQSVKYLAGLGNREMCGKG